MLIRSVFILSFIMATGRISNIISTKSIEDMLLGTIDALVSGCYSINTNELEYLLYNKLNPIIPITLTPSNLEYISSNLSTKIVMHGWHSSATSPNIIRIKDAYLERGDYNIILVNWGTYASANYPQARCNIAPLGKAIGDFIYSITKAGKMQLNKIHLVGASLGAHLAGRIGQRIQRKTIGQKLFRITGLDAAAPGFLGFQKYSRLDASDAHFVDGIHTDGAQLGYPKDYGSVDFYVNCGLIQPGCSDIDTDDTDLVQQAVDEANCSHTRSLKYFIESINSRKFLASPDDYCHLLTTCKRSSKNRIIMGEDCPTTATGSYCVATNSKPPYALG